MRYTKSILGGMVALLALSAQVAFAHTHLKSSTPADGSTLQSAPTQLKLSFEDFVQVTAVSVAGKGMKPKTVTQLPEGVMKDAVVNLPALQAGEYVVTWRAAGHDGHVMTGQVKFKIEPAGAK